MKRITYYPYKEEVLNVISHLIGFLLSILGLILLVTKSINKGDEWAVISSSIFGSSMVILYLASTLYHMAKKREIREKLNVFDHASIYLLIAGTYTPFCLIPLRGTTGWVLFGITWGIALTGIILKLFYTGRFDLISTGAYVLMGWIIVFAIKPLINSLSREALFFLFLGGISYTLGAVFYTWKKLPYNHAIFHFFVLGGTIAHFIAVYYFLL